MSQLGRFDTTVQSATGDAISGASVTVYREGATVNGNQSGTTPLTVTVRHKGKIATADTVFINTTTGTSYTVNSTTATTVVLSGFVGTLALTSGDRIIPSNSQPTLYSDDQGGATTTNPLTTTSTGRASCFMEFGAYDFIISGGGATTTLFSGQTVGSESPGQVRYADEFQYGSSTSGIQEAVNDLPTAGGTVYVGDGTKTISVGVDMTALTNVRIQLGKGCTVKASGVGNNPMFKILGTASNIEITGGTIDANSDAGECIRIGGTADKIDIHDLLLNGADTAARSAVFLNGTTTNVKLRNLTFRNCEEQGIALWDGATASCIGLVIDGIDYDSTNGGGANGFSNSAVINIAGVVRDFRIENIFGQMRDRTGSAIIGIDDAGGALCSRGVISNIVGRGANASPTSGFGIVLSKVNNVSISNVTLQDLGQNAIEVSEVLAGSNRDIAIDNVNLKNVGAISGAAWAALSIANGDRIVVNNVVIEGATSAPARGLSVADVTDSLFSNIKIMNGGNHLLAGSAGISIGGSTATTNNQFSNISIDGFDAHGVLISGTAITGQTFYNIDIRNITAASKSGIVIGGTNSRFYNVRFSGNTTNIGSSGTTCYIDDDIGRVQNVTAVATTLTSDTRVLRLTADANYTLTTTPTIADGFDGQLLTIINVDTVDTITLQDQGTLPASNLRLSAATIALAPRDSIKLLYNSTIADWVQIGQTNVI